SARLRVASDLSPGRRSGILALEGSSHEHTRAVFRGLREHGVVVSLRDNLIRVSPHIYNTRADIESFLETAAGVRRHPSGRRISSRNQRTTGVSGRSPLFVGGPSGMQSCFPAPEPNPPPDSWPVPEGRSVH